MINTNEFKNLRYGNLLHHDVPGYEGVFPVDLIDVNENKIVLRKDENTTIVSYGLSINYVPITDEWLHKLGFTGRKDFKWKGIVGIQIKDDKFYLALKDLSNVLFHSVVEVKCVHQLQNLYMALVGEELTINNK